MPERISHKIIKKSKRRTLQHDNRSPKRIRWALLALGLLLILIALGKLISFVGSLNDPYNPDGKVISKGYTWDGKSTINVIVKSDKLHLLSFSPENQSLTILQIPDETYLNLPYEYGKWPARSIYELGQAEKEPAGADLLKSSAQFAFGVPVDGYVILQGKMAEKPLSEVIDNLRTNLLGGLSLVGNSKTDLNLGEYLSLLWSIKKVRFDKINKIDLSQSQITKWLLLPDGSRVLDIDQYKLDQFMQKNFEDGKLAGEGLTVAIFNSTDYPGLAEKASRIVINMGGRVILINNFQTQLTGSVVLGKDSYTKLRLAEVFAPYCRGKEDKRCELQIEEKVFERADINIVLGKDFSEKFLKKQ